MTDSSKPLADGWEQSYHALGTQRLWPIDPTLDSLDLEQWKRQGVQLILDAGCGDGKNLVYLAQQGFFVVGLDISLSALTNCQHYLKEEQLIQQALLFSPTSIASIPAIDATFPAAICIDVIGHIPQPLPLLHELARVIKPGGFLYLSVFHPDDECRVGPRMRAGATPGEYWYRPSLGDRSMSECEYYYHFYAKEEIQALIASAPFQIRKLQTKRWFEAGHQGFREEPHAHKSWFILAVRE